MMNTISTDISLSVVVYRDYQTPTAMIQSLLQHTDSSLNFCIIAVDNSNLDENDVLISARNCFMDKFSNLESKNHQFRYIDAQGNIGFGRANNLALNLVNSEYHVFVNPDILFINDALSALKSFMDLHDEIGMCIPKILDLNGCMQKVYRRRITVLDAFNRMFLKNRLHKRDYWHTMAGEDYTKPFKVPFGQGSFLFARTDLIKKLGGFDDSFFMYLEDADLCRRVNDVSQFMYCPYATVIHKWEKGSHKNFHLFLEHVKSYILYFKKWGLTVV